MLFLCKADRMKGRPRKPILLHRMEGTYQPSRHAYRVHEPQPPGELAGAAPPRWLTVRQKRLWRDILERAPKGVLRLADLEAFAGYVLHIDIMIETAKKQAQLALVDSDGKPSPYLRLLRQTAEVMSKLQAELGFTPVARTRLGGSQAAADPFGTRLGLEVIEPDGTRHRYDGGRASNG